jgi:hypothetical protein
MELFSVLFARFFNQEVFIMSYFQGISIISCPKKIMQALTSRFNKPLALHYTYTSMLINAALHY